MVFDDAQKLLIRHFAIGVGGVEHNVATDKLIFNFIPHPITTEVGKHQLHFRVAVYDLCKSIRATEHRARAHIIAGVIVDDEVEVHGCVIDGHQTGVGGAHVLIIGMELYTSKSQFAKMRECFVRVGRVRMNGTERHEVAVALCRSELVDGIDLRGFRGDRHRPALCNAEALHARDAGVNRSTNLGCSFGHAERINGMWLKLVGEDMYVSVDNFHGEYAFVMQGIYGESYVSTEAWRKGCYLLRQGEAVTICY